MSKRSTARRARSLSNRAFGRLAVCCSVVVALVGPTLVLEATPAAASTSLSGEVMGGAPNIAMFAVSPGPTDPAGCDASGTSTVPFNATGSVSGPYPGTIAFSGSFTLGPQSDTGQGLPGFYGFAARTAAITNLTGTFTITSGANTVNGTFTGLSPVAFAENYGSCYGTSDPNSFGTVGSSTATLIAVKSAVNYVATVTGPGAGTLTGATIFQQRQANPSTGGSSTTGPTLSFFAPTDATPPTLAPTVTPNPVVQNGVATADPNASDPESGITSSSCDPVDTSTIGSFSVQCTATNAAGLSSTANANYDVIAPPPPGYVVNTTADHVDDPAGCEPRTASTDCTLREAIGASNAHAGPDLITFGILAGQFGESASSPFTIQPSPDLPWLIDSGTTIDGTTQSGYSGTPVVELAGDGAGAAFGLVALGSTSTIRGLAINRFSSRGVEVLGGDGSTVEDNYIGTDITGTVDLGNGGDGIDVFGSENNRITNNLSSGNGGAGIELRGNNGFEGPASGNVVTGNLLGTDVTGLVALPNSYGLAVGGNNNTIGGSTAALRNVISGNSAYGVLLGGGTGNHITGNYIGMKATGLAKLGNGNNGIEVLHFADGNFIGGLGAGEGNVVTGNGGEGIQVAGPNNQVLGNLVGLDKDGDVAFGNGSGFRGVTLSFGEADNNTVAGNTVSGNRIGIQMIAGADGNIVRGNRIGTDLSGTGSRPNVYGIAIYGSLNNIIGGSLPGDGNVVANNPVGVLVQDSGGAANGNSILGNSIHDNGDPGITLAGTANNNQTAPALSDASIAAGTTMVTGTLTSAASTTYHIEVFANGACDPSGHGEGERFVGTANVNTDAGGIAPISIPVTGVATGEIITTTATAPNGSTSIFSDCETVHGAPATITVDKVTYPANATQGFTFQLRKASDNSLIDTISGLHDADAPASFTPVLAGTYKVLEPGVNGWSSDGGSCDNTDTPAQESASAGSLVVASGEHWTCTFTNAQVGHLHLFKVTDPAGGSPNFEFTGEAPDFPTLLAGGQGSFIDLAPGVAHVISETPKPGWTLSNLQCSDPTSDSTTDIANHEISVTLDPGETVNCTFTNSKLGRIEVEKVTNPAGYGGFQFTGDITATLGDGDVVGQDVAPGTYHVEETLVGTFPWKGSVSCVDPTGDTTFPVSASFAPWATFEVAAGETVHCTFTNFGSAGYAYRVVTNPSGGTGFGFHFEGSPANLINDGGSALVSSLAGPARTIRQDLKPGWTVTSIVCDDPAAVPNLADRSATYTLAPGQIVTCTFTNAQVGHLHLFKVTDPAGGSPNFEFTGEAPDFPTLLAGGQGSFIDLAPGVAHVISETPKPGWTLSNLQCSDPTSDSTTDIANHEISVTLDPGETVNCTFTNSKLGRIEVEKVTNPAGYGGFQFTGDITATLGDGDVVGQDVAPGTYHVEETLVGTFPWKGSVSCVDPTGDTTFPVSASFAPWATFEVAAGETVHCTFTNFGSAGYAYRVVTNPSGGTGFGFHFEGSPANLINDGGSALVSSLAGPARTIRQDLKPGWTVTSIVCDDPAAVPNLADRSATYTLAPGQIVTCTFTNAQVGHLHLFKVTDPAGGSPNFEFTEGGAPVGTLADGEDVTIDLAPGNHVVSETPLAGWALTDIQCTDPTGDSTTDVPNHEVSLNITAGETVDCTFTNSKLGRIEVEVVTNPAGYGGFGFTGDLIATLADGQSAGRGVAPGTYNVTEVMPSLYWILDSVVCNDSDSFRTLNTATFNVAAGETVHCVFTAHGFATYEFQKISHPSGGTGFGITFDGFPMQIDDGVTGSASAGADSPHTVRELATPGWTLTSIVCNDPAATPNMADSTATYNLVPGQTVKCVFTNDAIPSSGIVIKKQSIGGFGTFTFNGNNGLVVPPVTTSAGANPNQTAVLPVAPGTYAVNEVVPAGWKLTGLACNDADSTTNNATATIRVAAGEIVTCTWTDTKRGAIVVKKQSVGGTATFPFTGNLGSAIPALNTATANPNQTLPIPVDPGTYTVTENVPSGWLLTGLSCDDGGDSTAAGATATIRVQPGETVTCTWTDTNRGAIVVKKQTIGGFGTFSFTADGGVTVPNVTTTATANPKSSAPIAVNPGTYHVNEVVPAGWDLTGLSCDDGGDSTGAGGTATIRVQPGETVTCTWTNTKRGTIVIRKNSIFGTGTFSFTADNGLTVPDITTTTAGTPKASPALPVVPGTYDVTESQKTDWTLTDLDCDDSDSTDSGATATIRVAAGETVTCTFENTRVRKADLALTIVVPTNAGIGLPYTNGLKVTNNGPDTSPGFTVTAYAAEVVAGSLPAGCTLDSPAHVTCTSTANLAPGASKTFNLTLLTRITGGGCTIWGTPGNDTLTGTPGDDVICGLGGDDHIDGGGGDDVIIGDVPAGYQDAILLNGGDGANVTGPLVDPVLANNNDYERTPLSVGTPDGDHLNGGGGNDKIYGQQGADVITGDVTNTADVSSGSADPVLDGGVGNDKIYGQGGGDTIEGSDGNDTLAGGNGDDTMFGHDGVDSMNGGIGNDDMNGGTGNDTMAGDDGNDAMSGSDGNDTMSGQGDDDTMNGGNDNDTMNGGDGNDAMNGNDGNDTVNGNAGNDQMNGSDGVDTMYGGNGNDTINGNEHNDEIHGGDGRDFLEGGGGTDEVYGDTGNDGLHGGTANPGQLNFLDGGTGTDCASAGPDTRTRIEAVNACTAPPP